MAFKPMKSKVPQQDVSRTMIRRSSFLPPEVESGLAQRHTERRFHSPLKDQGTAGWATHPFDSKTLTLKHKSKKKPNKLSCEKLYY